VAKIYSSDVSAAKSEKLAWMVANADPALTSYAAWPIATVHHEPRPGTNGAPRACGFLMKRIQGSREIHDLYNSMGRRKHFPSADWRFLIRTARNCAAAFDTVHIRNIVIGDVNQKNIFVDDRGIVTLIDCDSYQLDCNGTLHICPVGVCDFTPPELQGQSFANVRRTSQHDCFGLAVIIFYLLFVGHHPFTGRFDDLRDFTLPQAINEYRFFYSATAAQRQMSPPPTAPLLSHVGPEVASLFEQAFGRGQRPSAARWAAALEKLETSLHQCQVNPAHYYVTSTDSCPWCEILCNTGKDHFASAAYVLAQRHRLNYQAIANDIKTLPSPREVMRQLVAAATAPSKQASAVAQIGTFLPPRPSLPPCPTPPERPELPPKPKRPPRPAASPSPALPPKPQLPAPPVLPPPPSRQPSFSLKLACAAVGAILLTPLGFLWGKYFTLVCALYAVIFGIWWLVVAYLNRIKNTDDYASQYRQWTTQCDFLRHQWQQQCILLETNWSRMCQNIHNNWKIERAAIEEAWAQECRELETNWEQQCNHIEAQWQNECKQPIENWKRECDARLAPWHQAASRIMDHLHHVHEDAKQRLRRLNSCFATRCNSLEYQHDQKQTKLKKQISAIEEIDRDNTLNTSPPTSIELQRQLEAYLKTQLIRNAHIPGIGRGRRSRLESHGIESAFDVLRKGLAHVHFTGFSDNLRTEVVNWAKGVEAAFSRTAKTTAHAPTADIQQRIKLVNAILKTAAELRRLHTTAQEEGRKLADELAKADLAYREARAKLEAARIEQKRVEQAIAVMHSNNQPQERDTVPW